MNTPVDLNATIQSSTTLSENTAAAATFALTATVAVTTRSRTNLALHHLFAACRFSAQIGRIERENAGKPFGEF